MKGLFACLTLVIFLSSFTSATFALTHPYSEDTPLVVEPGTTALAEVTVLNVIEGNDEIGIQAVLKESSGVATLDFEGTHDVAFDDRLSIPLEVTIPEETPLGTEYVLVLAVSETGSEGSGAQFAVTIDATIPVVVGEVSQAPGIDSVAGDEGSATRQSLLSGTAFWVVLLVVLVGFILAVVVGITKIARTKSSQPSSVGAPQFARYLGD